MCNTDKTHCPLCHLRHCDYNWPPYNVERCMIKEFLGPFAEELNMDLLALRDDIESKFVDPDMFWGNFAMAWYIHDLQPVRNKGYKKKL